MGTATKLVTARLEVSFKQGRGERKTRKKKKKKSTETERSVKDRPRSSGQQFHGGHPEREKARR